MCIYLCSTLRKGSNMWGHSKSSKVNFIIRKNVNLTLETLLRNGTNSQDTLQPLVCALTNICHNCSPVRVMWAWISFELKIKIGIQHLLTRCQLSKRCKPCPQNIKLFILGVESLFLVEVIKHLQSAVCDLINVSWNGQNASVLVHKPLQKNSQ